nr:hypothetical protein [Hankyongella ginsenosidimutans]
MPGPLQGRLFTQARREAVDGHEDRAARLGFDGVDLGRKAIMIFMVILQDAALNLRIAQILVAGDQDTV